MALCNQGQIMVYLLMITKLMKRLILNYYVGKLGPCEATRIGQRYQFIKIISLVITTPVRLPTDNLVIITKSGCHCQQAPHITWENYLG